jgi:MinD superfamily P-loop ATPase
MQRVVELSAFFKIPAMLCVNKFDLNPEQAARIEAFARANNVEVMGRIPFDPVFTRAMVQGKTIMEFDVGSQGAAAVRTIWEGVARRLEL